MSTFLLYGATGYTGRLIAREAVARGLRPILAGRNAAALAARCRSGQSRKIILGDLPPSSNHTRFKFESAALRMIFLPVPPEPVNARPRSEMANGKKKKMRKKGRATLNTERPDTWRRASS